MLGIHLKDQVTVSKACHRLMRLVSGAADMSPPLIVYFSASQRSNDAFGKPMERFQVASVLRIRFLFAACQIHVLLLLEAINSPYIHKKQT